ncbi:hypothetical protein CEXT_101241 [Caerostris extrusa]|uniref:Uncharacterized protein n=1 Tax=Caerostris extrusa TaxID=172846 RepID=A0AAV4U289_CAEEX|nr:hypothetical protein CEXT_101241 [Caerostris extrusa]
MRSVFCGVRVMRYLEKKKVPKTHKQNVQACWRSHDRTTDSLWSGLVCLYEKDWHSCPRTIWTGSVSFALLQEGTMRRFLILIAATPSEDFRQQHMRELVCARDAPACGLDV